MDRQTFTCTDLMFHPSMHGKTFNIELWFHLQYFPMWLISYNILVAFLLLWSSFLNMKQTICIWQHRTERAPSAEVSPYHHILHTDQQKCRQPIFVPVRYEPVLVGPYVCMQRLRTLRAKYVYQSHVPHLAGFIVCPLIWHCCGANVYGL